MQLLKSSKLKPHTVISTEKSPSQEGLFSLELTGVSPDKMSHLTSVTFSDSLYLGFESLNVTEEK